MNGRWYILAAAILWGTTGTSQAFAPQGATPLAIGALRLIVGGLVLLALALWKTDVRRVGRWHWPTAVAAGLSTAMYQVTFFAGVKLTGVAVGTLIAIGSAPIFAGILGDPNAAFRPRHGNVFLPGRYNPCPITSIC